MSALEAAILLEVEPFYLMEAVQVAAARHDEDQVIECLAFIDNSVANVVESGLKLDHDLRNESLWCFNILNVVVEPVPHVVCLVFEHAFHNFVPKLRWKCFPKAIVEGRFCRVA